MITNSTSIGEAYSALTALIPIVYHFLFQNWTCREAKTIELQYILPFYSHLEYQTWSVYKYETQSKWHSSNNDLDKLLGQEMLSIQLRNEQFVTKYFQSFNRTDNVWGSIATKKSIYQLNGTTSACLVNDRKFKHENFNFQSILVWWNFILSNKWDRTLDMA